MSNLIDAFGTDLELEEQGVWVEVMKGVKVKLKPLGNDNYRKFVDKLKAPHLNAYRTGTVDADIDLDINMKAVAKEVLVDWDGVEDPDTGKTLPYSFDNALKILKDARIKRFTNLIITLSAEQETFKRVQDEESEKNLEVSCDGLSNGKKLKTK